MSLQSLSPRQRPQIKQVHKTQRREQKDLVEAILKTAY